MKTVDFRRTLGVILALAATASAAPFTVLDGNLARVEVEVTSVNADRVIGTTPQGRFELPLRDLLMLQRDVPDTRRDAARFQLVLRNGERLTGSAQALQGDAIVWQMSQLGTRTVPLAALVEIVHTAHPDPVNVSEDEASRDVMLLANGDRVSGIIASVDEATVSVQNADGQTLSADWANIRAIRLAPAGSAPQRVAAWRLASCDGSVVDVDAIAFDGQSVIVMQDGERYTLPVESVRSIEHRAGRAKLLTGGEQPRAEYAPYFPRLGSQATIMVPDAVSVGDARTRAFIAVRPYSRLTWALDGSAALFKTRFAVAPVGPLAGCHARIWLDDTLVMDRPGLSAATPMETFETPLGGAKTITLEVDFGDNFDVQDQLFWIEPALIDEK